MPRKVEERAPSRVAAILFVCLTLLACAGLDAPRAGAAFGFKSLSTAFAPVGGEALTAGSHPETWSTTLSFNTEGAPEEEAPEGALKDLRIELPPGLVGAPALLPSCSRGDFIEEACPASSAVGTLSLDAGGSLPVTAELFLLEPAPGYAAQLGLHAQGIPVTLDLSISERPPNNLIAAVTNASQASALFGSTLTLYGSPNGIAFLTLPRSCAAPLETSFAASSWAAPESWATGLAPEPAQVVGCGSLAYSPQLAVSPTTSAASAPSGLDVDLRTPDPGIASPTGRAAADTETATLELPPGLTVNPPVAAGLEGCTPAQLASELPDADPRTGCPEASLIGSASVDTPLFAKPIPGSIYVAAPAPASLLGLYLVLDEPERGLLLTLPIRIDADPASGRLTARFTELPQLPLSRLELSFNSGPRAPLTTPSECGAAMIAFELTPSSGNSPLEGADRFATSGNCPTPFAPELEAGTTSNAAGRSAGFVFSLSSAPTEPSPASVELTLPPGLSADFASLPEGARLGYVRVALGTGSEPLWVPADPAESGVYLDGPYQGAPRSLRIALPARAGPFDLGTVALRAPLRIDPRTAQASVEIKGLPRILEGIPLRYRTIRMVLDPGFIRNPTSCGATRFTARLTAIDGSVSDAAEPFQAADCGRLAFSPRARLRFEGAVAANGHPGLLAELLPGAGQANLSAASLLVPRGELVDPRSLRIVCSAAEFTAASCPPASAHGSVQATSPALAGTLSGTLYLVQGSSKYPQLAARLSGPTELTVSASLRTPHGRLRADFEGLPDIPLSSLELRLAGGRRGLLVNSEGLCREPRPARAAFTGQNGKRRRLRPLVAVRCPPAADRHRRGR